MNPILTIGGVVPGVPEMTHWRTGMNPVPTANPRTISRGPTISLGGMVSGAPTFPQWNTAYPNGESIYVAALRRAEAKAALEDKVRELPRRTRQRSLRRAA